MIRYAVLVAILLAAPASAEWSAPKGTLGATEIVLVHGPPGQLYGIIVDDPDGGKGEARRLEAIACDATCTYQAFIDTADWPDGAHTLTLVDLQTGDRQHRDVTFDNSRAISRVHAWPDAYNHWPTQVEGPGDARFLFWIANLGNQDATLSLAIETPGWQNVYIKEVRRPVTHAGDITIALDKGASLQANLHATIPETAPYGGTLRLSVTDGQHTAAVTHDVAGWQEPVASGAPAPWLGLIILGLLWATRTK